jgi:hypothetical protein
MIEREKVIKSLEECSGGDCSGCQYFGQDIYGDHCWDKLMKVAAELLKEQDTPTRPVYNGRYWECEQCKERYKDILAVKEYKHCPGCGRRIEWQG